jgi:hypothetical protein
MGLRMELMKKQLGRFPEKKNYCVLPGRAMCSICSFNKKQQLEAVRPSSRVCILSAVNNTLFHPTATPR